MQAAWKLRPTCCPGNLAPRFRELKTELEESEVKVKLALEGTEPICESREEKEV